MILDLWPHQRKEELDHPETDLKLVFLFREIKIINKTDTHLEKI
jgi:hypothetical protein